MRKPAETADPGERALYHLAACDDAHNYAQAEQVDELKGPADSRWSELLCSIMEGLERGWVREAKLYRAAGKTHLHWQATASGDRAIRAFRRRAT